MDKATTTGGMASIGFILATVFISMLGVGLVWPILPKLINELTPGEISDAAFVYGLIATIYALAQFLASPVLGAISDSYGRKPVLVATQLGLAVDYLLLAIAPNLWWLTVARLISGLFGATIATAHAYMADITPQERRSRNFGLIGATFGLGFIIGPLVGGFLGELDIRYPFYLGAALSFANALFGLLVVPESLAAEKRSALSFRDANPLQIIRRVTRFPALATLLAAMFLTNVAQRGLEAIWVLYTEFRFSWSVGQAGFSLAFVGCMFVIVQGGLVGPVVRRLGEWNVVAVGYLVAAIALGSYGLAERGWMTYPLIAFHVLGYALATPALQSIASGSVSEREQGRLQGTLSSINSLAIILGPLAASFVLSAVTARDPVFDLPGAWFLFSAFIFIFAGILIFRRRSSSGHGSGS